MRDDPPIGKAYQAIENEREVRRKNKEEFEEEERLQDIRDMLHSGGETSTAWSPPSSATLHDDIVKTTSADDEKQHQISTRKSSINKGVVTSSNTYVPPPPPSTGEGYLPPHVNPDKLTRADNPVFPDSSLRRDSSLDLPTSQSGAKPISHDENVDQVRTYASARTSKFLGVRPQRRVR